MTTIFCLPDDCIDLIATHLTGPADDACVRVCASNKAMSSLFRNHFIAKLEPKHVYDRIVADALEKGSKVCSVASHRCLKTLCKKAGLCTIGTSEELVENLRVSCERRSSVTGLTLYFERTRAAAVKRIRRRASKKETASYWKGIYESMRDKTRERDAKLNAARTQRLIDMNAGDAWFSRTSGMWVHF
jgi:hypothetical protein